MKTLHQIIIIFLLCTYFLFLCFVFLLFFFCFCFFLFFVGGGGVGWWCKVIKNVIRTSDYLQERSFTCLEGKGQSRCNIWKPFEGLFSRRRYIHC